MTKHSTRNGAGYMLSHFLPRRVFREARDLAIRSEQDELFKTYVLRKLWLVFPAFLFFIVVSSVCVVGVVISLLSILPATWGKFSVGLLLVLVPVVWLGGILSQLYLLFKWLEKRALRKADAAAAQSNPGPSKAARFGVPLAFGIFVVLPLGALAISSSKVAMILIACLLVAPIALTLFED